MLNYFVFDNKKSRDFGILIADKPKIYGAPAMDIETISVPGKSGDLRKYNNRLENYILSYRCNLRCTPEKSRKIKSWLYQPEYKRLYDSYVSGYFRWAALNKGIDDENGRIFTEFDVEFTCKPYLYSFEGEKEIDVASGDAIYNPEAYSARPIIKLTKTSSVTTVIKIGSSAFKVNGTGQYTIDAETQSCYYDGVNRNSDISSADIEIAPGENYITRSGGALSEFKIIPRWRTL